MKKRGRNTVKIAWLCTIGFMLLGMVAFGAHPAQAASGVGPYYATPSWDQTLAASTRFIVLTNMSSAAVLDQETGLVWLQSPISGTTTWGGAQSLCSSSQIGGRMGWRLPTNQELNSLIDPSQSSPALPSGHPFSNVVSGPYWTSTKSAGTTGYAHGVDFNHGSQFINNTTTSYNFWCVRGGTEVDAD